MDENPEYKSWLLGKLAQRDFLVTRDFRSLILTENLIPLEYRSKPTGNILVELHQKILEEKDYYVGLSKYMKDNEIAYPFSPMTDGVDHVNIYSKAHTDLGQVLSNFALTPFNHPEFGQFNSVEGFWYWLATGMFDDKLRSLYGYQAKEHGKKLDRVQISNFKVQIKKAILLKVDQNDRVKEELKKCNLPFTHYYYYGNRDNAKVIVDDKNYWFVEWMEMMRRYAQGLAGKTIIAGSRNINDYKSVKRIIECSDFDMIEIVSGKARGIDSLGERYANDNELPVQEFPADWDGFKNRAGPIRNGHMANYADRLIAIWDGESVGTLDMVRKMYQLKKPVEFYKLDKEGAVHILNQSHIL